MKVLISILNNDPPELPKHGPWTSHFHAFIADCLQKNPQQRPTVAQLLKNHKNFFDQAQESTYMQEKFLDIFPPLKERIDPALKLQGEDFLAKLQNLNAPKKKRKWDLGDEENQSV